MTDTPDYSGLEARLHAELMSRDEGIEATFRAARKTYSQNIHDEAFFAMSQLQAFINETHP